MHYYYHCIGQTCRFRASLVNMSLEGVVLLFQALCLDSSRGANGLMGVTFALLPAKERAFPACMFP